jgi:hypothetical protein
MNRRRVLLMAAALLVGSTTLARADEVGDIVRWLRGLGFDEIATARSLLGRVQIRATGAIGTRELVVNPRTGEILRDVWIDASGKVVRGKPYAQRDDDEGDDHRGGRDSGVGDNGNDDNSGHGGDDDGGDDNSGSGGGDGGDDDESDDDSGSDDSKSGGDGSGGDGSDD